MSYLISHKHCLSKKAMGDSLDGTYFQEDRFDWSDQLYFCVLTQEIMTLGRCWCQTLLPDLLVDRLMKASTHFYVLGFFPPPFSWMDQRCRLLTDLLLRMRSESVFLYIILSPPPLFSVIIISHITILLTSKNLYDYLLKLLQINICLCVSVLEEVWRDPWYRRFKICVLAMPKQRKLFTPPMNQSLSPWMFGF